MEELFIEKIKINQVRHLKDVEILISDKERKHLILTGKNGSGKTSVLEEITEAIKIQKTMTKQNGGNNFHIGIINSPNKECCAN